MSVCHEATRWMRVGPSVSAYTSWYQTVSSCCIQKVWWWALGFCMDRWDEWKWTNEQVSKVIDDDKTEGWTYRRDNGTGNVYCCVQVIRHGVGMTSIQAIVWNVGGSGMKSCLNVGAAHSSVEGLVMRVERRGSHVREEECINCESGRSAWNLPAFWWTWRAVWSESFTYGSVRSWGRFASSAYSTPPLFNLVVCPRIIHLSNA